MIRCLLCDHRGDKDAFVADLVSAVERKEPGAPGVTSFCRDHQVEIARAMGRRVRESIDDFSRMPKPPSPAP